MYLASSEFVDESLEQQSQNLMGGMVGTFATFCSAVYATTVGRYVD